MNRWVSKTCKTKSWPDYNAALKPRAFSDKALQTSFTREVIFGMTQRQITGFVESLLRLLGLYRGISISLYLNPLKINGNK
jgi:hypothetical protein